MPDQRHVAQLEPVDERRHDARERALVRVRRRPGRFSDPRQIDRDHVGRIRQFIHHAFEGRPALWPAVQEHDRGRRARSAFDDVNLVDHSMFEHALRACNCCTRRARVGAFPSSEPAATR